MVEQDPGKSEQFKIKMSYFFKVENYHHMRMTPYRMCNILTMLNRIPKRGTIRDAS